MRWLLRLLRRRRVDRSAWRDEMDPDFEQAIRWEMLGSNVRSAEWKEGYDAAVRRYGDDLNRITAAIEAAWIDGKIALTAAELKDLLSMTEKPLDKIEASITHGQRAP